MQGSRLKPFHRIRERGAQHGCCIQPDLRGVAGPSQRGVQPRHQPAPRGAGAEADSDRAHQGGSEDHRAESARGPHW